MIVFYKFVILVALLYGINSQSQSVYEYFADTTELTGLVAENNEFRLNGKHIRIISGAIHYFRVHPELWRDRLRKLRAIGANTVETYVSWNLHEPVKGEFDFGDRDNDFSPFMNIRRFVQIAQEEDLLVILRPGPYICAEWEYGGFPSWLQRDPEVRLRENNPPYLARVKLYLDALLIQLAGLQFDNGGSIIAMQIENEFRSFKPNEKEYLEFIRQAFLDNGFDCLHFTSDNGFWGTGTDGTLPGLLQTANFKENPESILDDLLIVQPDKPIMVMEFWTGWFTNWFDEFPGGSDPYHFHDVLETIFSKYNGSVNFYMFHGGTNFAFTAGGGVVRGEGLAPYTVADVTSYDYEAPLTEAGDYTLKYDLAAELIEKYENPKLRRPDRPSESLKTAYATLSLENYLTYGDLIDQSSHKISLESPISMELLPINGDSGQMFGYIVYRKTGSYNSSDIYRVTYPQDQAQILVDGRLIDTGYTGAQPQYIFSNSTEEIVLGSGEQTIDLLVEIIARTNWAGYAEDFIHQKGIAEIHNSKIEINNVEVRDVEVIAMEFNNKWVKDLINWRTVTDTASLVAPCLVQSTFTISGTPTDTFLNMKSWHKGIVFINGFNIGRYWKVGPQQHLYVPAPLLQSGINTITIFEQYEPSSEIIFSDVPWLGSPQETTVQTSPTTQETTVQTSTTPQVITTTQDTTRTPEPNAAVTSFSTLSGVFISLIMLMHLFCSHSL